MSSTNHLPCSKFWQSTKTREFIAQVLKEIPVDVPSNAEPWQLMVAAMEKFQKAKSVNGYHCLWKFVDLFLVYGSRLKKRWGPDWAEIPAEALRKDHQSLAFLRFLEEAMALDRDRAHVAWRTTMLHKGLPFKMPGGHLAKFRSYDFGVEFLIGLTAKIDAALANGRESKNQEDQISDTGESNHRSMVLLDYVKKDRLTLTYKQQKVDLTPKQTQLLNALIQTGQSAASYIFLCKAMNIAYKSVDTGPPEALKTHKKDIVNLLHKAWGKPPRGAGWIETQKLAGYLLNPSVKWKHAKGASDKGKLLFRPPHELDSLNQRDKEERDED